MSLGSCALSSAPPWQLMLYSNCREWHTPQGHGFRGCGNPSSIHRSALRLKTVVAKHRRAQHAPNWRDEQDAEIEPVPTSGGGHKPEPELDRLSNILKTFNDQFGNISWSDEDRVHKLITEEIPARVAADTAFQNASKHSDKQNARIEHDKALSRVLIGLMKDDTELFKQFSDNPEFKRWLADTIFSVTYQSPGARF